MDADENKTCSIISYLILIVAIILIFATNFFPNSLDPDSARYMLSALIQSEAAILAIVVSLSLVAVQLTSASYSPRVIHIFQKSPHFWILIGVYLISICLGLYTLNQISSGPLIVDIYSPISLSFRFGVVAFVALIPYIWNTLELLKPVTILEILSQDITKKSIMLYQADRKKNSDPFQPIIDIIILSINKYDHTTLSEGLSAIRGRIICIFENDPFKDVQEELDVVNILFQHFRDLKELSSERYDNTVRIQLMVEIWIIGSEAINKEIDVISDVSAEYLREFLKNESEQGNDEIAEYSATYLTFVALDAVKKATRDEFEKIVKSIISDFAICITTSDKICLELTTMTIVRSLKEIIQVAPGGHFEDEAEKAINSIDELMKSNYLSNNGSICKFKHVSCEHLILECEKSLGFLYYYVGRLGEAKISLQKVTGYERRDNFEDRYNRHWYGEAWHKLGQTYHYLGDNTNEKEAFNQALAHEFKSES